MLKKFTVNKSLAGDIRVVLQNAVEFYYKDRDNYDCPWLVDYDSELNEAYFDLRVDGVTHTYVAPYTMNENKTEAFMQDIAHEVVRVSTYERLSEVVDVDVEKSILSKLSSLLNKVSGGTNSPELVNKSLTLIKQFEDEDMEVIEKLYINPLTEVDKVGDGMTLEDTYGMVDSLNKAINSESGIQSGLFHRCQANDVFTVKKAWVSETDCMIGDTLIEEGQPLIKVKFHNKAAFELRKVGVIKGISIGARATEVENL